MNRFAALDKMRDSYRAGDLKSLKRQFAISQWFLTEDDKAKITAAITEMEHRPPMKPLDPLIEYALSVLGGRIIDDDNTKS